MLHRIRLGALGALFLLPPGALTAQDLSESIPREFVEVFLGGAGGLSLYVDSLPGELARVVPSLPDGRVVGATKGARYGGTTAVVAFEASPGDVLRRFEDALAGEGWTRAPPREEGGGFVAADTPTLNLWCSADFGLQPSVRWQNGVSYLRLSFNPRSRSLCDGGPWVRPPRMNYGLDLPTLVAPPGVDQRGGGGGGSDRRVRSETQLQGPLPPSMLAVHYGTQLEAAGWTQLETVDGEGVSVRTYDAPGADGGVWRGLLTLWQGADGMVFATLVAALPEPF